MTRRRAALTLALALFLLTVSLSFHNVWPTVLVTWRFELSLEITVLVAGLALWLELGRTVGRGALTAIALVLLVLCLGRYAEVTAPALYGRPVNLYWDAQHVPKVIAMLAHAAPPAIVAAGAAALVAALAGLFWVLRASVARVVAGMAAPKPRRVLGGGAAALAALYALGIAGVTAPSQHWFALPVTATYLQQARFVTEAFLEQRNGLALPPLEPAASRFASADLARLGGADVLVVFIESYGASVYDSPVIAHVAQHGRDRLGTAVTATGRQIVSAFVESPTFGGGSWLAHITLFSGVTVRDSGAYTLMLTQSRPTLARRLKAAGYRAVAVMPGLRSAWPEGAFYGFDHIYDERALDYRGPEFGWWRIPDQYSLARLHELEIAERQRAPLAVFFPTINTHTPFMPVPPYQPDWARMLSADPYDAAEVEDSLAERPEWTNMQPAYAESVRYALTVLGGYLREHPDYDPVLVVVGDHQPQASVTGPEARWDVPVHVITRNDAIIDSLLAAGFVAGVTPRPEALGPLEDLTGLLLGAFSSEPLQPGPQSATGHTRLPIAAASSEPR